MGSVMVACPDPEVLSAFSRGRLEPSSRTDVEAHLDGCETCCRVVAELVRVYAASDSRPVSSLGAVRGHEETLVDHDAVAAKAHKKDSPLTPGTRLDRYYILEKIGAGGMGVVYAAYDGDLDRKVALKVLHEHGSSDMGQRRLLREAQSMARLSHPNVITVHEVRMVDQQVFISMEFVEGGTLGDWLEREQPGIDRILSMFCDIGRGLSAAHAAGLVHRDIKPDNVLIGADERPRVTDFGLARTADDDVGSNAPSGSGGSRVSGPTDPGLSELVEGRPLERSLTRTGALVGTPAYMAPEQFRRLPTTAASDQFSLCVALWEALYGERPFTGRALPELAANVLNEDIREPTRDPGVPRRLRQVLRRGLSLEPTARWPSMEALVEQLTPSARRSARPVLVLGVLTVALAAGGLWASGGLSAPSDPCRRAEQAMDELWAHGARAEVEYSLSHGSSEYAADTARRAVGRIDDYVEQWSRSHREACEGYQRGELSDEALDLRSACLDDRRDELTALVDVLTQADSAVRRHAVEAIDGLPALGPCADIKALRARVPPPEDPRVRAAVHEIERDLARGRALLHAGQYGAGQVVATSAIDEARRAGYPPLTAQALRLRALLASRQMYFEAATADLIEAWHIALESGDDTLAAQSLVDLVEAQGYGHQQFAQAEERVSDAQAMIARVRRYDAPGADRLDGELALSRGRLALRQHDYDAAIELFRAALAEVEQRSGPHSLRAAVVLNATGNAMLAKYNWSEGLSIYERVLDIRTEHLGPNHPETAHAHNSIGLTLKHLERIDESIEHLVQAETILIASMGAKHPMLEMAGINLAETYFSARRFEDATRYYDRYLDTDVIEHGYQLRRVGHYARALSRVGRYEDAQVVIDRVLEHAAKLSVPGMSKGMIVERAWIELQRGDHEAALEELSAVIVTPYPQTPIEAEAAVVQGLAWLARGQPADRERAAALVPMIEQVVRKHDFPHREEVARLTDALAASAPEQITPPAAESRGR